MRRLSFGFAMVLFVCGIVSANGSGDGETYADGFYFAQEEAFAGNGWKYIVTFEIKEGKFVFVDWNGAHVNAGVDKKTVSKTGGYPMVERGGAQSEWYEQAALVEEWLLKKQNPAAITYTDDEGHTDAIAGVSVHVVEMFNLIEQALADGPVGPGMYRDGSYHAELPDFSSNGWKDTADFTVIGGYVTAVNWNAVHKDGGDDKKTASMNGDYAMKERGGAQSTWHEQAALAEAHFLNTQGAVPRFKDDDGHTDAITGVSVGVGELYVLAAEALPQR